MTKNELAINAPIRDKNPLEELVSILLNFTSDQLLEFLNDPITVSILRPEEANESALLEVS